MNNLFFSRFCGLLLLCSIGVAAFAQKGYKRAYTLFNAEGKEIPNDQNGKHGVYVGRIVLSFDK